MQVDSIFFRPPEATGSTQTQTRKVRWCGRTRPGSCFGRFISPWSNSSNSPRRRRVRQNGNLSAIHACHCGSGSCHANGALSHSASPRPRLNQRQILERQAEGREDTRESKLERPKQHPNLMKNCQDQPPRTRAGIRPVLPRSSTK